MLLSWDFCDIGFLHYKNKRIPCMQCLLCAQIRFVSPLESWLREGGGWYWDIYAICKVYSHVVLWRVGFLSTLVWDHLVMFSAWTIQKLMKLSLKVGHSTNLKHSKSSWRHIIVRWKIQNHHNGSSRHDAHSALGECELWSQGPSDHDNNIVVLVSGALVWGQLITKNPWILCNTFNESFWVTCISHILNTNRYECSYDS